MYHLCFKCFIQFACINLDGSQKEGGNFFNLLQKEGGSQKRRDPTVEETMITIIAYFLTVTLNWQVLWDKEKNLINSLVCMRYLRSDICSSAFLNSINSIKLQELKKFWKLECMCQHTHIQYHACTKKGRYTYVHDISQLSNPA